MAGRTKAERETIIRWSEDGADPYVYLWTASPSVARGWGRRGYQVEVDGTAWRCVGPKGSVRVRRVSGGVVVKRNVVPPHLRKASEAS